MLFDDERFKLVRVRLRRKGNQETPWMVMPGLLHRRKWLDGREGEDDEHEDADDMYEDDDDDDDQGGRVSASASPAGTPDQGPRVSQLVPVEEQPDMPDVPPDSPATTPGGGGTPRTPATPVTPLPKLSAADEAMLVKLQARGRA